MKQYLIETKTKSHLLNADFFKINDIMDSRKAIISFFKNNGDCVAVFNASNVRAVIEQ